MIKPKTGAELQLLRKQQNDFYRQIKEIVLPHRFNCKVFIGGCIERGVGSSFRAKAHAHNDKTDPDFGVLCFRSIKRLGEYHTITNSDGTIIIVVDKPSRLLLHEYAHILAPNQYHNKTFDRRYRELLKHKHA